MDSSSLERDSSTTIAPYLDTGTSKVLELAGTAQTRTHRFAKVPLVRLKIP